MKKALWWGMSISVALCAALVLLGCPDDKDPGTDPEFEGKILKVTDIPLDVTILASFLIEDLQTLSPDVSGLYEQEETTGIFNLCYATPPLFLPDRTRPWEDSGEYYVGLAVSLSPDDPQYFYTDGKEVLDTQELQQNLQKAFQDPDDKQTLLTFFNLVMQTAQQQGYDQMDVAAILAILADPDNKDAIEILAGVAQQSVTIKKYNIEDKTTKIEFSKFKLLSQEKIFDDLIAFFMSPGGMLFLMLLLS
ncbi:MAG: hypothetical protein FWF55_02120 [Treponema sp.]|nr:hypothetical protein [Treponema sp.]